MLALSARGISKTYQNNTIVSEMDFSLEEGEVHALIGPKGCGKKTAVNIFCGMIVPTRGKCSVFETSIRDTKNVHNICGLVSSDVVLYSHLSGLDNLILIASFFGLDKDTAHQRAAQLMKELEIWELREVLYKDYSTTEKKLLSLARAMLHSPKILFFEKKSEDDNIGYSRIITNFIKNHNTQENLTVCVFTDDAEFSQKTCSNFTIMHGGEVLDSGTLPQLIERHNFKTYARIKAKKELEGFEQNGEFLQKEIKDENEFSKLLLDAVLLGAGIKSAEIYVPDFAAIYNKILEDNII